MLTKVSQSTGIKDYIIIGDIHGRTNIVEAVLSPKYEAYIKIFVGDYVDSYDRPVEDQIHCLSLVLLAAETRDDVIGLIGNHELSYIEPNMECSGYNQKTAYYMSHLKDKINSVLDTYVLIEDDILVTHAGAGRENFSGGKQEAMDALASGNKMLYNIGYYRGGNNSYGGIFWNDFNKEHEPIIGLTQIMGHTAYTPDGGKGIVEKEGDYCVDCLADSNQVLCVHIEQGKDAVFTPIDLFE